jgi:peptidoglycan hydrolase-like protein with peptidoglycan-binding domain
MTLVSRRFARNTRLQAAARNSPPLKKSEPDREAVSLVQQALVDVGFAMPLSMMNGKPDGIYGDETVNTVADFQTQQTLQRDGQAGHDTLHHLDSIFANPPLTEQSILRCPHGGTVQAVPSSPLGRRTAGLRILTANDVFVVSGCPFGLLGSPSPCLTVRWVVSNPQFRVNGRNTLNARSVGICANGIQVPQGSVVIVSV